MRIALAVTDFPSISQTFVLDHACGLIDRGHSVELHALARGVVGQPHASIEKYGLIEFSRYAPPPLPAGGLKKFMRLLSSFGPTLVKHPVLILQLIHKGGRSLERLRRSLSFWGCGATCDVIHAHSGYNGERVLPLYELGHLRMPLVVTFHGHDVHAFLRHKPLEHFGALFARASALVVCSGFMQARLLSLGAPPEKLHVIPNGVDIDGIVFRERHPPQGRSLRLLTIGRLVPFKGLHVLIEALRQPSMQALDWQLDLVGDGPLRPTLVEQAEKAGLAERIVFHGACAREKVLSIIDASDLYLAPAVVDADGDTETQGVALLEAMASGLPVIASSVGGIPETLGTAAAAFVPPGDANALAAAVKNLLLRPESWAEFGHASRERVDQHYDRKTWIDRLEALYIQLEKAKVRQW